MATYHPSSFPEAFMQFLIRPFFNLLFCSIRDLLKFTTKLILEATPIILREALILSAYIAGAAFGFIYGFCTNFKKIAPHFYKFRKREADNNSGKPMPSRSNVMDYIESAAKSPRAILDYLTTLLGHLGRFFRRFTILVVKEMNDRAEQSERWTIGICNYQSLPSLPNWMPAVIFSRPTAAAPAAQAANSPRPHP